MWFDNEDLDWNNDPQDNQEEANDGAQVDESTGMNNPDNLDEISEGGGVE